MGSSPITRSDRRHSATQRREASPWVPIGLIVLVVVAVHAPLLSGWLDANPIHLVGYADLKSTPGPLPGFPVIDPNLGFTSQALGHRSALDWLHGIVPWWNPYEGIGSPLAAGLQAASFFPPTLLTIFANGQLFIHLILESCAGVATFFLLRELAFPRWLATLGGVLFSLNGTFAWLGHAPANPVAFLPLLLLGIERAFRASQQDKRGGWLIVPLAIALSIVAGFPETAFIDGLLAALWIVVRLIQGTAKQRKAFAAKIVKGGVTGLLLAAPLLVAVYDYLPSANIGVHAHVIDDALPRAALPLLLMPYALGPIDGFNKYDPTGTIANLWGGGFITTSLLFLSIVSLAGARQRGLRIALAGWAAFGLTRVMGVGIVFDVTKLIPGLDHTLFSNYSAPSWEFAILLLALFGLHDVVAKRVRPLWVLVAGLTSLLLTGLAIHIAREYLGYIKTAPGHEVAANLSALWATLVILTLVIVALAGLRSWRFTAPLMCITLLIDVSGMFVVPELSYPSSGQLDVHLIDFLQGHLGTGRFYTFGPISPNYGSYFGIASINVNDVPVPKNWARYITTKLDTNTEPLEFTGYVRTQPNGPTAVQEFRDHVANYAWVGVKYVVTASNPDVAALAPPGRLHLVFADGAYDVFQLHGTAPFFQTSGSCTVHWSSWNAATSDCARATQMVRRELYSPGWSVSINGQPAPIREYDDLFETIAIPSGRAIETFSYTPPHERLATGAAYLGLLAVAGELYVCWRRHRKRTPSQRQ